MIPLVLASASPARLKTLRQAGIEPQVIVSHVDEDAVLTAYLAASTDAGPSDAASSDAASSDAARSDAARGDAPGAVLALATAKAREVVAAHKPDALVLGCDSMLEIDGEILGKPGSAEVATERWRQMRGRTGVLHTGHWLVDARATGTAKQFGETASTIVHFAQLTDAEIVDYVATSEPLAVAGGFTVDGLGGPYVERIEGDYHNVVGLSLPVLRSLLARIDVPIHYLRAAAAL